MTARHFAALVRWAVAIAVAAELVVLVAMLLIARAT